MRPPWPDCTPTAGGVTTEGRSPTPSSTGTWPAICWREWTGRLSAPDPRARTIVAELDGEVVGLAHTRLGEDAAWGALLDNLHVSYGLKRLGVGTRLLALTAQAVLDSSPASGLYLWVLEQNAGARAFYTARGGTCVETVAVTAARRRPVPAERQPDGPEIRLAGPVQAAADGGLIPRRRRRRRAAVHAISNLRYRLMYGRRGRGSGAGTGRPAHAAGLPRDGAAPDGGRAGRAGPRAGGAASGGGPVADRGGGADGHLAVRRRPAGGAAPPTSAPPPWSGTRRPSAVRSPGGCMVEEQRWPGGPPQPGEFPRPGEPGAPGGPGTPGRRSAG